MPTGQFWNIPITTQVFGADEDHYIVTVSPPGRPRGGQMRPPGPLAAPATNLAAPSLTSFAYIYAYALRAHARAVQTIYIPFTRQHICMHRLPKKCDGPKWPPACYTSIIVAPTPALLGHPRDLPGASSQIVSTVCGTPPKECVTTQAMARVVPVDSNLQPTIQS